MVSSRHTLAFWGPIRRLWTTLAALTLFAFGAPSSVYGQETDPILVRVVEDPPTPATSRDVRAELVAGKLIQHGFTAGVGLVLHIPTSTSVAQDTPAEALGDDGKVKVAQTGIGTSAAAYVGWLPFRQLIRGNITRAYCASAWALTDAQDVANSNASAQAKTRAVSDSAAWKRATEASGSKAALSEFKKNPSAHPALVRELTGWDMSLKGKCWLGYLPGVFVAIPADFTTTSADNVSGTSSVRAFDPIASAGLVFAPISAFSVLIGWTISGATVEGMVPDDDGTERKASKRGYSHSISLGVGANFDLVGLILK